MADQASTRTSRTRTTRGGGAMLRELAADGPDPRHGDALALYAWLIGSWEIDNRYFDEADGAWHSGKGLWHFGWILRGRGI